MRTSLSISVVTYAPQLAVLAETLETLAASLAHARGEGSLAASEVSLVDNGPGRRWAAKLEQLARPLGARVLAGHGNLGYGAGHNRALLASQADYHLVLNPDVALAPEAVHEALRYMGAHPRTVILAPEARDPAGEPLFLCKRYPSVLDLALRGFAPGWLKRRFRVRLERFEMRDLPRT
jgi:GT2 family glycosyltransferase